MQRTRLWRMSLNLLVGGKIRYTTRGEDNRTVGREWLHKIYRYYLDSLGYWLIANFEKYFSWFRVRDLTLRITGSSPVFATIKPS